MDMDLLLEMSMGMFDYRIVKGLTRVRKVRLCLTQGPISVLKCHDDAVMDLEWMGSNRIVIRIQLFLTSRHLLLLI